MADYFTLAPLRKMALDTLTSEFDSKLGPLQLQQESAAEWLPELCEAIRLVYTHDHYPVGSTRDLTPIRAAFVGFVHTARFYFLQDADFNRFLDGGEVPPHLCPGPLPRHARHGRLLRLRARAALLLLQDEADEGRQAVLHAPRARDDQADGVLLDVRGQERSRFWDERLGGQEGPR